MAVWQIDKTVFFTIKSTGHYVLSLPLDICSIMNAWKTCKAVAHTIIMAPLIRNLKKYKCRSLENVTIKIDKRYNILRDINEERKQC